MITLYPKTNDKAEKTAVVEYDGEKILINNQNIDAGKIFYQKACYGNCGDKLYLHAGDNTYLFTMTEGFWNMYYDAGADARTQPIKPDFSHIIAGIVELFEIEDVSWAN